MISLSVAIICLNEEKRIEKALESVVNIADEIVVVDSYSTDSTEEICRRYNVKWIQNKFQGHIEQKNFALDQCKFDHVLSIDADEALSPELEQAILEVKRDWGFHDGYSFNRLTRYVDKWIYRCGWYPDTKLRLVNKKKARWQGFNPHDILVLEGQKVPKKINGDLLHFSYLSIADHVRQTNKFTTIAAKTSFDSGTRSSTFKIVTRPIFKFLRDYFWKRGLLDGRYGFVICYINALSAFLKYSKIKELQDGKLID